MRGIQRKEQDVDLLIARMREVRSAAQSHVGELQGEAKRLVDWKEYVLAKPIASVAAASILGFAIIRSTVRTLSWTTSKQVLGENNRSDQSSVKSTLASSAIALATSIASSSLKSYFANLVQRSISEGGSK